MLAVFSAATTRAFPRRGRLIDFAIQSLLRESGVGSPTLQLWAARRRFETISSLDIKWGEGRFGPEAVLSPRDPANPLSQFVSQMNERGFRVCWAVLPPSVVGLYSPRDGTIYVSSLDINAEVVTFQTDHQANHAHLHLYRQHGIGSGPAFSVVHDGTFSRLGMTELLLTGAEALLHNLEFPYPPTVQRQGMLHLLSHLRGPANYISKSTQAILSSPSESQVIRFGLGNEREAKAKSPTDDSSVVLASTEVWGATPLNWVTVESNLNGQKYIVELPTRLSSDASEEELKKEALRRLRALAEYANGVDIRLKQLEFQLNNLRPGRESAVSDIVESLVRISGEARFDPSDSVEE